MTSTAGWRSDPSDPHPELFAHAIGFTSIALAASLSISTEE